MTDTPENVRAMMGWPELSGAPEAINALDRYADILARYAGDRIPEAEAKPPAYTTVWTDRGAMVWDGSIWRSPTSGGATSTGQILSRWKLLQLQRRQPPPAPTWWLRERR